MAVWENLQFSSSFAIIAAKPQDDGRVRMINMSRRSLARSEESNGRVYDPTLARFLSPDNHVQAPDNRPDLSIMVSRT